MRTFTKCAIGLLCLVACVALYCVFDPLSASIGNLFTLALGTSFSGGFGVRDASLKQSVVLPSAASTTVAAATGMDTGSSIGDFLARNELLLTAPALNTTVLPDTKTMTYNLIASASANLASPTVVEQLAQQTGAGGA